MKTPIPTPESAQLKEALLLSLPPGLITEHSAQPLSEQPPSEQPLSELTKLFELTTATLTQLQPSSLLQAEKDWAEGIKSKKRKSLFLAGRSMMRRALEEADIPQPAPILPDSEGRPQFTGTLNCSLSHTGELLFFVWNSEDPPRAVGADVQLIRDTPEGLKRLIVSSEEERSWINSDTNSDESQMSNDLVTLFSAKEAAFKAISKKVSFRFMPRYISLSPLSRNAFQLMEAKGESYQSSSITVLTHRTEEIVFSVALSL